MDLVDSTVEWAMDGLQPVRGGGGAPVHFFTVSVVPTTELQNSERCRRQSFDGRTPRPRLGAKTIYVLYRRLRSVELNRHASARTERWEYVNTKPAVLSHLTVNIALVRLPKRRWGPRRVSIHAAKFEAGARRVGFTATPTTTARRVQVVRLSAVMATAPLPSTGLRSSRTSEPFAPRACDHIARRSNGRVTGAAIARSRQDGACGPATSRLGASINQQPPSTSQSQCMWVVGSSAVSCLLRLPDGGSHTIRKWLLVISDAPLLSICISPLAYPLQQPSKSPSQQKEAVKPGVHSAHCSSNLLHLNRPMLVTDVLHLPLSIALHSPSTSSSIHP